MTIVARATGVSRTFCDVTGELEVLSDVTFELRAGELALLMGPSGSGKTTLVAILAGLLRPTRGAIEICGRPLGDLDESERAAIRRRHVGFVFQTHNLFPALSALENVALGHRLRGRGRREARAHAHAALVAIGLEDRLHHRPSELSTGEQQRVAIARALSGDPALLIGDEPTAALDGAKARAVIQLVRARMSSTTAALIVTHDRRLEEYADRILVLEDGRLVR
ncbi:MAG: ABC transporter ATP-binding protein [Chromatiales bacterium]